MHYLIKFTSKDTSLWLAIAGIQGEGAQTRDEFLELFPDFHIPEMKIPLRLKTKDNLLKV